MQGLASLSISWAIKGRVCGNPLVLSALGLPFLRTSTGKDVIVDSICSYQNDRLPTPFDRVRVYEELSNLTNGGTKIGQYIVEKNSLHVNGKAG